MSGPAYPPPRSGEGEPPKAVAGAAAVPILGEGLAKRDDRRTEASAAPSTMLRMVPLPRCAEEDSPLGWLGIVRLGLVQTALGAIFVLSTSTLNRVMKIELELPAILPGLLIALQYFIQVLRPRLGYGSDVGGRRTPLIVGGMAVLAVGGVLAALAIATMTRQLWLGLPLAFIAFIVIGVSACGTSLLVLLATRTAPARRPAAAGIAWIMMIMGFIVTAGVAGRLLDPFSPTRLVAVASIIAGIGFLVTLAAVWGVEGRAAAASKPAQPGAFGQALREVWAEPRARRFALFVFVSMLAYGGEELMIEPFAGSLFGMSPGETARLSGVLHVGSLFGMVLVAVAATTLSRTWAGTLRLWMVGGCLGSGAALAGLAAAGMAGSPAALRPLLFALGLANGGYAIAAIGSMMQRIGGSGDPGAGRSRDGVRMGLWGAAQAVAFGCGGLGATALSDAMRESGARHTATYAAVFAAQGTVFAVAALMAARLDAVAPERQGVPLAVPVARG